MCRLIGAGWAVLAKRRSRFVGLLSLIVTALGPNLADAAPLYAIQTIDVPGAVRTEARGVNNHGHVVGSYEAADGAVHGFLFDGAAYHTLSYPGAVQTDANGINDSGQIVGSYHVAVDGSNVARSFLLDGAAYSSIGRPDGAESGLHDINNSGAMIGSFGAAFSSAHGFMIANGQQADIRAPGARATHLTGISDSGKVVGYAFYSPAPSPSDPVPPGGADIRAFVFESGQFDFVSFGGRQNYVEGILGETELLAVNGGDGRFLFSLVDGGRKDLSDLSLLEDVNDFGQIVGSYGDGTTMHGYIATPVPEPTSLSLLMCAVTLSITWALLRQHA